MDQLYRSLKIVPSDHKGNIQFRRSLGNSNNIDAVFTQNTECPCRDTWCAFHTLSDNGDPSDKPLKRFIAEITRRESSGAWVQEQSRRGWVAW